MAAARVRQVMAVTVKMSFGERLNGVVIITVMMVITARVIVPH